jgi:hypothetical protein
LSQISNEGQDASKRYTSEGKNILSYGKTGADAKAEECSCVGIKESP